MKPVVLSIDECPTCWFPGSQIPWSSASWGSSQFSPPSAPPESASIHTPDGWDIARLWKYLNSLKQDYNLCCTKNNLLRQHWVYSLVNHPKIYLRMNSKYDQMKISDRKRTSQTFFFCRSSCLVSWLSIAWITSLTQDRRLWNRHQEETFMNTVTGIYQRFQLTSHKNIP